jgi:hypothetical protein
LAPRSVSESSLHLQGRQRPKTPIRNLQSGMVCNS